MNAADRGPGRRGGGAREGEGRRRFAKQQAAIDKAHAAADKKAQAEYERLLKKTAGTTRTSRTTQKSPIEQILGSKSTQTILSGVIRECSARGGAQPPPHPEVTPGTL